MIFSLQKNGGAATAIVLLTVCSLFAVGCAGQIPPSGGPPDTTPPTILSTYPESHTIHFKDNHVVLEFSEYVDRRSVEESVFISPDVGNLEFEWSGREVEIQFGQSLRENLTYVVTVGTDVIDVRNKNRMAESFSLPFSTGAVIDSASLQGKVFDPKPQGITILAYALHTRLADTLDPAKVKPDYATQSGTDGTFTLGFLSWGRYRLYAVRDHYKNLLYDPQVDDIGMTTNDPEVSVERPIVAGIHFQLSREDTTLPFLQSAEALDRNLVIVKFSEALDSRAIVPAAFSVVDTTTSKRLAAREVFFDPRATGSVQLRTDDLDSSRVYRLTATGLTDTAGNPVNPAASSVLFPGTSLADTTIPRMTLLGLEDSVRNVAYDMVFDCTMSEGVRRSAFERGFQLIDSTGQNIPGTFSWWSSSSVRFRPMNDLYPLAWYRLHVRMDSVMDYSGNRLLDSVLVRRFQTIDWRKFGSIRGRVEDLLDEGSEIILFAASTSDKTSVPIVKKLKSAGDFAFENLLEGHYVLQAFSDRDGNGKYTPGKAFPYAPSERFVVYSDTIKVRARWPVEGVVVRLGER